MNCGFWTYDGKYLIAAPQEWGDVGDEVKVGFDTTGDGNTDYEETFYIGDLMVDLQTPYQPKSEPKLNFVVKRFDKKKTILENFMDMFAKNIDKDTRTEEIKEKLKEVLDRISENELIQFIKEIDNKLSESELIQFFNDIDNKLSKEVNHLKELIKKIIEETADEELIDYLNRDDKGNSIQDYIGDLLAQLPEYGSIQKVEHTGKNVLTDRDQEVYTIYYDYSTGTQTTNYDVRDKNFEIGIGKIYLSSRYGYQYENQPVKINGMTAVKVLDGQGFKEGDTIEVTLKNSKGQQIIERFYCDGVLVVKHEPTKGAVLAIMVSNQIAEDKVRAIREKYKGIDITGVTVSREMFIDYSIDANIQQ